MDSAEEQNQQNVFPGYETRGVIGRGGFGTVYECKELKPPHRTLAIKYLRAGIDTEDVLARFQSEQQALAALRHENIAAFINSGESTEGRPFFVLELVEGPTLHDYLDRTDLSCSEKVTLFKKICTGIYSAHARGIIHRDLKPTNVLIDKSAVSVTPKIIDFGLAKATQRDAQRHKQHTSANVVLGTWDYMSPEQTRGLEYEVDTRSDIYSLGCLLYFILYGETVFLDLNKKPISEIIRVICEENPAYSKHSGMGSESEIIKNNPFVSELKWIVLKCLRKNPEDRYGTVQELVADLDRLFSGDPIKARPPSTVYRWTKYAKKYKSPITIAATFVLSLLALSYWALEEREISRAAQKEAHIQKDLAQISEKQSLEKARLAKDQELEANKQRERASISATEALRQAELAKNSEQEAVTAKEAEQVARIEAENVNETLKLKVQSLQKMASFFGELIENLDPNELEREFKNQLTASEQFTEAAKMFGDEEFHENLITALNSINLNKIFANTTRKVVLDPAAEEMGTFSTDLAVQADVHEVLGDAYSAIGENGKAINYYKRALVAYELQGDATFDDVEHAMKMLGWCYVGEKNVAEAVKVGYALVDESKNSPDYDVENRLGAKTYLARMLYQADRFESALIAIEENLPLRLQTYTALNGFGGGGFIRDGYISDLVTGVECCSAIKDFEKGDVYLTQLKAMMKSLPTDFYLRPSYKFARQQFELERARDLNDYAEQNKILSEWAESDLRNAIGESVDYITLSNFAAGKLSTDIQSAMRICEYGFEKYFENKAVRDAAHIDSINYLFDTYISACVKSDDFDSYIAILPKYLMVTNSLKNISPASYLNNIGHTINCQYLQWPGKKFPAELDFDSDRFDVLLDWVFGNPSLDSMTRIEFADGYISLSRFSTQFDIADVQKMEQLISSEHLAVEDTSNLIGVSQFYQMAVYRPGLARSYIHSLETYYSSHEAEFSRGEKSVVELTRAMMYLYIDKQVDKARQIFRSATAEYEEVFHSDIVAAYYAYIGVLYCIEDPKQSRDGFTYSCFEKLENLLDLPDSREKLGPARYIDGKMECYFYRSSRNGPENISREVLEWFQNTFQEINKVSFDSPIILINRQKLLGLLTVVVIHLKKDDDREVSYDCIDLVIEYIQSLCSRPSHVTQDEYTEILNLSYNLHDLPNVDHKLINHTFLSMLNGLFPEKKSKIYSDFFFGLAFNRCVTSHTYAGESNYFNDLFSIIEPYVFDGTIRDANLAVIIASFNECLEYIQEDQDTFITFHSELAKVLNSIDSITDLENRISGLDLNDQSRFFSNLAICCLYLKNTSSADKYLSLARSLYVEPNLDEIFFSNELSPTIPELKFRIALLQVASLVQQNRIFEASGLATTTFSNLWDFHNSVGSTKQFSNHELWEYLRVKLLSRLLSMMGITSYLNGDFYIAKKQLIDSNKYLLALSSDQHELFKNNMGYIRLCLLASGSYQKYYAFEGHVHLQSIELPQWATVEPTALESVITIYEH